MSIERNCLSFWFPKLLAAGLPVPRTEIVDIGYEEWGRLRSALEGEPVVYSTAKIEEAVDRIGRPCFLRTGQTSGKHQWKGTCYIGEGADISRHVFALVEYSECAGFMGLPANVWCARELLPTKPLMRCDGYGDMPVCKEFRFFVRDKDVVCWHPYWPLDSLKQGMHEPPPDIGKAYTELRFTKTIDVREMFDLASLAGAALGGEWSVDILETERGWYITDMAVAGDSFHWEGCEKAAQFKRSEI